MSAAIKNFFNHNREVAQRRKEWESKMIAQLETVEEIEEPIDTCEEEFSECDNLLRRDWFIDDVDILDLIQELPDTAFYRIVDNAHNYSPHIQDILYRFKVPSQINEINLKVREIDEDEMEDLYTEEQTKTDERFEKAWQTFKVEMGLIRPEGNVDNKYNDLFDKLNVVKRKIEEEKNKSNAKKTYVPPHLRGKQQATPVVNVEIEKLQTQLQDLENEIKKVKIELDQEETKWEDERKQYHFTEIWHKMCEV